MSREELSTCLLGSIHVLDPKYYASKNWDEGARVFIAEKSNSTSVSEINLNFDIPDDGFDISGPAIKEELYHGDKSSN
jgi:hypothetical protein